MSGKRFAEIIAAVTMACQAAVAAPELVCDPPDFVLDDGECRVVALDRAAASVTVSLAVDFPRKALSGRSASAALTFMDSVGRRLYEASLSIDEDPSLAGFGERALRLSVDSVTPAAERVRLLDFYRGKDANIAGGVNCLSATIGNGTGRFSVGGNAMALAGEVPMGAVVASVGLTTGARMEIRRFAVTEEADPAELYMTPWTVETLTERFASSSDPVEGFWSFLDRDNDPEWAIPGGFYELAIVKSGAAPLPETSSESSASLASYDIIYLSGATVEGRSWIPGMRKGAMTPTIFADHYKLSWIDARFQTDYPECTADLSASNTILTLRFPLHRSQLRFSRRPLSRK